MDCNKIYLKMDRYETVVFCNDDVNVYVLCSKAEGKAIYIDSGGGKWRGNRPYTTRHPFLQ